VVARIPVAERSMNMFSGTFLSSALSKKTRIRSQIIIESQTEKEDNVKGRRISVITAVLSLIMFMAVTAFSQSAREIPKNIKSADAEVMFNSSAYQSGIRSGKNLDELAKANSYLDENAVSFGFAAKSEEAKFFIIGTLYSETLAYLQSGRVDSAVKRLKSIEKEFINLNVPSPLYNLISKVSSMLSSKKYSAETGMDVLSLFQPFFEEYAKSSSEDKLALFRAGSWLMDYSLSAAADNRELLRQPGKLDYFIKEMKRMDAPKGVMTALNEIDDIAKKKEITDKDTKKVLRLVKKIQTILG
jgi:hypothetical protein